MINVLDGAAPFDAFEGEVVTIVADKKEGKEFEKWTTTTAGVTFEDATQSTTTFIMPASEVTITAVFKIATTIDEAVEETIVMPVLYPNPATDYIQLANAQNTPYKIYNVVGTVVLNGITNGEPITLSGLIKGVYLFEANGKVVRFIKR